MKKRSRDLKLERYRKVLRELDSRVDGLGLGLDGGIRKTVALLNLLGFRTVASCEGHLDPTHGTLGPWVDTQPTRGGGYKRNLKRLLKAHWKWEWKQSGNYPAEFFMPYLWDFARPTNRIRIQIGQEIFEKVKPFKGRIPKPVRSWVYRKKKESLQRFTGFLWRRYFGTL